MYPDFMRNLAWQKPGHQDSASRTYEHSVTRQETPESSTVSLSHLPSDLAGTPDLAYVVTAVGSKTVVLWLNQSQCDHGNLVVPFIDSEQRQGYWVFRDGIHIHTSVATTIKQASNNAHQAYIKKLCFQSRLF